MNHEKRTFRSSLWHHFLKKIVTGIVTVVPLAITLLILKWVFLKTDGILSPLVRQILSEVIEKFGFLKKIITAEIPGLGFILMIILLYLLGLFATNYLGKKIVALIEKLMLRIPLVKGLYHVFKQLVDAISMPGKQAFQKVVLVNFFGSQIKSLGFVTGSSFDRSGEKLIHVFIPTTPNPTAGFIELVREDQIEETAMTVEEGWKMLLSVGVISPEKIS